MFLWRFRSRVPYLVAMDWTPLWCERHSLWYAHPPFNRRSLGSKVRQAMIRRVYSQAFHLLPWSWSCRESLMRDYGISPERITVVPPGIDLRRYDSPDRTARSEAARPLNVLFVGADFTRKGGDLLARLAQEPEFKGVQFNFVTRGYQGPTGDNIRVFEGVTANSAALVNLFREADVFALPTRADTHSVASLEAMAMGLPVITTPVGGIPDIVQDGETGCLIARDDMAALTDRLRMLKQDRGRRLRMGLSARKRVETHFNSETIATTVANLLRRAAASSAKGVHTVLSGAQLLLTVGSLAGGA
jgi:glycosyltransferase involved in cell wall biosynthesis